MPTKLDLWPKIVDLSFEVYRVQLQKVFGSTQKFKDFRAGDWGLVRWVATLDHDGQIEMSLSTPAKSPPAKALSDRFFAMLSHEPVSVVYRKNVLHCVMKVGLNG